MDCRNNGPSEQWAVGIMGCRNNDLTLNSLPENIISAKDTKIFEHRLDNYWKDQDLLYNYESNLIIGIEIDEKKELSIVVGGQCSERTCKYL
jgi:hypothetical protein